MVPRHGSIALAHACCVPGQSVVGRWLFDIGMARNMRQFALSEIVSDLIPHSLLRGLRKTRQYFQAASATESLTQNELSCILSWFAMDTETAIVIMDARAIVLWVNPAFTRLTGYAFDEVVGERVGRAQHGPDTDLETVEAMRKAILAGESSNLEMIHYTKGREPYWVDIETRPIRNSNGEVEYFLSSQKNITSVRKQNEQLEKAKLAAEQLARDLTSSRQQLRMAADAGGLSLWDWDLKGDRFWLSSNWIPVANEQWVENCGLRDLFTLAHEDDFPRINATINRLLSPNAHNINEQFRMLIAGKWRWVNFRGAVSARDESGQPVRVSGTLLDETDRKEAEERAQADRELLQCVIEHIPHAVFWKDAERRYLGCNGRFAQSLGLESARQVVGRTDAELRADPTEAQRVAEADQAVVISGQEIIGQHQPIRLPDQSQRDILYSKVPLRSREGHVFGMLGVFGDITQQRRMERQLADAQQLESIGRLAAGVAHEINTPMQYISDNVEFLSESTSQVFELIDSVQEQIDELQRGSSTSVASMSKLRRFDQKLDFIRTQVPKAIEDCLVGSRRVIEIVSAMKVFTHPGTKSFVHANLNDLIVSAASITRNRWKYSADVALDLEPDLPLIRCLPTEINQVILNLLVNAADAVAERFGTIEELKGKITITTRRVADGVTVLVQDNGCGIPESIQSKIFNPFFTTKGVGKGTGQGLTLCYAVVCNKHGGNLTVESQVGQGTTFRVFLPTVPCPVDTSPPEALMPVQDCLC